VRADITYLRQDFSVVQPVLRSGTWPSQQRYDYLVRLRALLKRELTQLKSKRLESQSKETSPQKRAILYALKGLTGKDAGSVNGWKKLFGRPQPELRTRPETAGGADLSREVIQLRQDLVTAHAGKRERLLREYRDSKGGKYTDALGYAIPRLSGAFQNQARQALADRLTRMNAATLRDKLSDESPDIRRAAITACLKKKSKIHIPEIISLLNDADSAVSGAAHRALATMSGRDFGPPSGASRVERAAAVARWKKWWAKHGRQ
jgi:hypothetical protein